MSDDRLTISTVSLANFKQRVLLAASNGRFAAMTAYRNDDQMFYIEVVVSSRSEINLIRASLELNQKNYPSLSPQIPAAIWYEREIHDTYGLIADGHPELSPLVSRPTECFKLGRLDKNDADIRGSKVMGNVRGEGVFSIPYGPVRSGVFESIEYRVYSFGEDIPLVEIRPYYKRRGVASCFEKMTVEDGVILAERVEGTLSVAHATAYCQGLEQLSSTRPPKIAELGRVILAELERIANHLDTMVRHTEAAGQAIAYARLSFSKERIMRLRSLLSGSRFSRGIVVPGGLNAPLALSPMAIITAITDIENIMLSDIEALMTTPSFLDRLRNTGKITVAEAAKTGAIGPIARASGSYEDIRGTRPYGGYRYLGFNLAPPMYQGDALARALVRIEEIRQSLHLIRQAADEIAEINPASLNPESWRCNLEIKDGLVVSSVESPQGELLYHLEVSNKKLKRVWVRCASFHNMALFPTAFKGDILTDFAFIEASFGLCIAGVAG